jgi:hypothetical protein
LLAHCSLFSLAPTGPGTPHLFPAIPDFLINLYPLPKQKEHGERSKPPFTTLLIFQSPATSTTLMLYNTSLIYILQTLTSLAPAPPRVLSDEYSLGYLGHPNTPLSRTHTGYAATKRYPALEICRSIPYYQSRKSQLNAGLLTIAHLAVQTAFITFGGSGSLGAE